MKILVSFLLISALFAAALAGPSPAASPFAPSGGGAGAASVDQADGGSPLSAVLSRIASWQREMRTELSARVRTLKTRPTAWGLFLFLGLAFLYGAVHAAGPGHGKSVATSYVLARGLSARRGALLGALMGAAHASSAVVLVLALHALARGAMMNRFEATGIWVERGSYALVAAIGLWLVASALFGNKGCACCADGEQAEPASDRDLLGVGLATGMVPCPGAAIMLLFSLALDALWLGLAAVLAMACGMAATIASAAVLAACCRGAVATCAGRRPGLARAVSRGLALAGGLVVLVLGAALLGGSFS